MEAVIPKIELHSHISGCYRQTSINKVLAEERAQLLAGPEELIQSIKSDPKNPLRYLLEPDWEWKPLEKQITYSEKTWDDCMKAFVLTSIASRNTSNVLQMFSEVIEDYANDGTIYAEFRIGLKGRDKNERAKFCETLIQIIKAAESKYQIIVKLLVSVARHATWQGSFEHALEDVEIAEMFPEYVVGVELGGNPYSGSWKNIQKIFDIARSKNLKVALHLGENSDKQEEWNEMIDWKPDRIGHATFVNSDGLAKIQEYKIPLELCITVASDWFCVENDKLVFCKLPGHPVIFCCDNTSLFATTFENEYTLAREYLGLNNEALAKLSYQAIDYAFCATETKNELKQRFEESLRSQGISQLLH